MLKLAMVTCSHFEKFLGLFDVLALASKSVTARDFQSVAKLPVPGNFNSNTSIVL